MSIGRISRDGLVRKVSRIDRFFSEHVKAFKESLAELELEIDDRAVPRCNDPFHRRVQQVFQQSQDACRAFEQEHDNEPDMILDAQEGFRHETEPWFNRSWIAHRSRTKPSGFAGDFEMLIKLYDEATPARGLGGYLDLCILDLPLARAVRARLRAAKEFLRCEIAGRDRNVRILDIACGPCREYAEWTEPAQGRTVEVVAMDNDPVALAYVDDNVGRHLPDWITIEPVRYNALRTRNSAARVPKFGKFDVIYSVGLCDYLSDEHLIRMLGAWRETLDEGGVLYIAFKDTQRYDKTPYQWHLDWFFFQRTKQDVLDLYDAAGFDIRRIQTTRDDTGIIINFIDRCPAGKYTRMDVPARRSNRLGDSVAKVPNHRE